MNRLCKHVQRNLIPTVMVVLVLAHSSAGWSMEPENSTVDLEKIEELDLRTAARIALEENPTLAAAQARVEQARQAIRQAKSSYWPRLDLSAAQTRTDLSDKAYESQLRINQAIFGPGATVTNPETSYQAAIAANWLLFDGFSRWYSLEAAKYGAQSSEAANIDARRLLLAAISNAFLSAQSALEAIAIAKADESFNQRQLTEAKLRYEVGTGALSDVLNFEVRANSAQSDRIFSEKTYQTAKIGLAVLMGFETARLPRGMELVVLGDAVEAELQPPELDQPLQQAYELRPDLLQNDAIVRQAEADVKVRQGQHYPTISLAASYGGETTDNYFGFEAEDFGYSVGVNLSFNIFAGGLIDAQQQQAKMRLHEAEKNLESLKLNVASEIQTIIEDVKSAQKQYFLLKENAQLVRRNRDLVEKEYKAGVGSLVRLNEAQRDLTAADVRLASAQVALRQAWYDLWSATGQIESRLIQ